VHPPQFSYGIAVAGDMRRKGAAKAALPLLFAHMQRRGFTKAVVQIAPDNAASIALHQALGFVQTQKTDDALIFEYALDGTE